MSQSITETMNSPGSAAYSPSSTAPDNAIIYGTRSTRGANPNESSSDAPVISASDFVPPSPSVGGQPGSRGILGWTDGFLNFRLRAPLTGRVLTRPTMGAHPPTGPVGYSTRSQRLRNGVKALTTDYTPSSQAVAVEITETM